MISHMPEWTYNHTTSLLAVRFERVLLYWSCTHEIERTVANAKPRPEKADEPLAATWRKAQIIRINLC